MGNEKIYQKNWFIWLMFAVLSPIGIILMWINKKYKTSIRVVLSVFYFLFFIGEYGAAKSNDFGGVAFIVIAFVLIPYLIIYKNEIIKRFSVINLKNQDSADKNNVFINKVVLLYRGGYPGYPKKFSTIITRNNNDIIFLKQNGGNEEFRIDKNNIINIRCDRGNIGKSSRDIIVMKIKYEEVEIELLFASGLFIERDYGKLISLIYAKNCVEAYNIKNYKKHISLKPVVACICILIFVITGVSLATKSNTASVSSPKQASVDTSDLQTYLRNKLNDNGIQIEDSTNITGYLLIKDKCSTDTKSGLSYECYQLLNTARTRNEYKKASKIGIMITADLTDQYGRTSNDKIFMQDFDKSELNKIVWDNIDQNSMSDVGETPWYHNVIKLDK